MPTALAVRMYVAPPLRPLVVSHRLSGNKWCFPQIMHRETVRDVADLTGAAITTRGVYVPPGHRLPEGERKLYLLIQVRLPLRELCSPPPGCLCSAFHVSQCWSHC